MCVATWSLSSINNVETWNYRLSPKQIKFFGIIWRKCNLLIGKNQTPFGIRNVHKTISMVDYEHHFLFLPKIWSMESCLDIPSQVRRCLIFTLESDISSTSIQNCGRVYSFHNNSEFWLANIRQIQVKSICSIGCTSYLERRWDFDIKVESKLVC